MSAVAAQRASLLVVLAQPRWWVLSLAGFLARGGLIVLVIPMVALPSTTAIANAVGPALVGFLFGGPSTSFLLLVGSIVGALVAWLLVSGLLGAALDLSMSRQAITGGDLAPYPSSREPGLWAATVVRWLAHVPTLAALWWGATALVSATYQELVQPGDATIPLPLRVILDVPVPLAILAVTWLLGEAVGGLAVRHLAWGAGIRRSLARAVLALLRPSAVAVLVLTDLVIAVVIATGGLAISISFQHAQFLLIDRGPVIGQVLALILLSGSWIATASLIAVATAWRATAWTYEAARSRPRDEATPDPA